MFDIGFSEIFIVAVVALLVLGPERLPRAARFTGLWVRRARAQWHSVKSELESELADDELKRSLASTRAELREIRDDLQNHGREIKDDFRREGEDIKQALKVPAAASAAAMTGPPVEGADTGRADTPAPIDHVDAGMTGAFDLGPQLALTQDAPSSSVDGTVSGDGTLPETEVDERVPGESQ